MNYLRIIQFGFFWIFLMTCAATSSFGQGRVVRGKITDAMDGTPLPGTTVLEKGTNNGTVTDLNGNYSLTVSDHSTLIFTFIGFRTQEVVVGAQTTVDLALEMESSELDEIVVIGYGETTTKELTGAIAKIGSEAVTQRQVPRVDQALQGQLSGVNISTNSGAPGGSSNIRIRGLSSNGDNDPLILVDGVVYDSDGLNSLNPSDIESINVLKDATAGIYGVRAANGVILIETKKGKRNAKPSFEFSGYYGVQQAARRLHLLNAHEYAVLKNEAFAANGQTPPFNNVDLGKGTDWQDQIFEISPVQNYNLSMTGGTDKTSYNIGASYFGQQGIVGGSKSTFDRYNARANFVTELAPKLTLTHITLFNHEETSGISEDAIGSVLYNAINAYPTEPVMEDGHYSYLSLVSDIINPVAQIHNTYNWANTNKVTGKEELSYDITNDLKVSGRAGYNYALVDEKSFYPLVWYGEGKYANTAADADLNPQTVTIGDLELERGASVYESRTTYLDYNLEAFLNYDHTFGGAHTLKGTLGTSYFGTTSSNLNGTAYNVPNNDVGLADISANQADNGYLNTVGSWQDRSRLVSAFLRAEYDYKKRYLISGVIRRDGSSRFGENHRFGYFPSISGAWIISDEAFVMPSFISFAKLRVSYGISGNDKIGNWAYRANLNGEGNYVFNDVITTGTAIGTAANPDLKWETTRQFNVGMDLTLWHNLDVTANYFIKKTKDLLFQPDVSAVLGTYGAGSSSPYINGGDVLNMGVELDLNYSKTLASGFRFSVNYNVTYLNNKVMKIPAGVSYLPGAGFSVGGTTVTRFEKGYPIGYFIGYKTNGVFQNESQIESAEVTQADAQPGDLRFVDVNHDGQISFGDDSDRTKIGSPIPDYIMGLNLNLAYKGFDFSANFYASIGNDIIRNYERQQPYANMLAYNMHRWTGEGSTNKYPRLTTGSTYNTVFSDFYVENGSYLRLKNVQFGYNIPVKLTEKIKMRALRIYVSANNLFTLTRYMGYDPDVASSSALSNGVDTGTYPQARMLMGGLTFKF